MDTQRLSAVLLIASAVGILLSAALNAPGLYQTQDIGARMQIIGAHRARWLASQAVGGLSAVLLAVAFAMLASDLRSAGRAWVPVVGAAAIAAGTISGVYFVYLQVSDPRGGYSGAYPTQEQLTYWLWLAGQLLIGVAMLQSDLPAWLGYLTAGTALAYGIAFLVTGAGFMTPFLLALVSIVIGVVLLRQ